MKFIFIFLYLSCSLYWFSRRFFFFENILCVRKCSDTLTYSLVLYTFALLMKKVLFSIIKKGLRIILWFNLPLFIRYPWMKMKINIRLRVHKKVLLMFIFFLFWFCFCISNSSSVVFFACVIFSVIIEQRFRAQVVKYVVYSELEKFLLGRYIIIRRNK